MNKRILGLAVAAPLFLNGCTQEETNNTNTGISADNADRTELPTSTLTPIDPSYYEGADGNIYLHNPPRTSLMNNGDTVETGLNVKTIASRILETEPSPDNPICKSLEDTLLTTGSGENFKENSVVCEEKSGSGAAFVERLTYQENEPSGAYSQYGISFDGEKFLSGGWGYEPVNGELPNYPNYFATTVMGMKNTCQKVYSENKGLNDGEWNVIDGTLEGCQEDFESILGQIQFQLDQEGLTPLDENGIPSPAQFYADKYYKASGLPKSE